MRGLRPPLVLVPLGVLGGLGAGATAATAVLGAPGWMVASLLLLTATIATAAVRRRLRRRRSLVQVTAQGRATLPLTEATTSPPDQTPSAHGAGAVRS